MPANTPPETSSGQQARAVTERGRTGDESPSGGGSSPPILQVESVTKTFPGVQALREVSFSVLAHSIHGLIGANGAGKSTLMKILNGVYGHGTYAGRLLLRGEVVRFSSPHDARRQGIGYVPQETSVVEALTVAENIFAGDVGENGSVLVSQRQLRARAGALLEDYGIRLEPQRVVGRLSASQKQLVMIARALATKPSVLILDEPTSALTIDETERLFAILARLRAARVTTIYISHRLSEIFAVCDRATALRDGQVAGSFEHADFNEEAIVAAMVGRRIDRLFPPRQATPTADTALRVEGLTIPHPHIARRNIVDDVSFHVDRGEIVGLAGLIGSGRTEILSALYGRLPHRGRVYVDGKPVRIRRPSDAQRLRIALVTEDRAREGMLFNLGIRENMTVNSLARFSHWGLLDGKGETRETEHYLAALQIRAPSLATLVGKLSGGTQQKVVLARALMAGPRIMLLDEPTKGVDVGTKHEIYKLIVGLADEGIALVVVSSELSELVGLCDRSVILAHGRVVGEMSRAEASEERIVAAATVGAVGAQP
jgi:ribose transport system ATP-binding protein/D-xylose transport system ATP-binding protein